MNFNRILLYLLWRVTLFLSSWNTFNWIVFECQIEFSFLTYTSRLFDFSQKIIWYLFSVRYRNIVNSILTYFCKIVIDLFEGMLHKEPKRSQRILLLTDSRNPSSGLTERQLDIFIKEEIFVFNSDFLILSVDSSEQLERIDSSLVLRHDY